MNILDYKRKAQGYRFHGDGDWDSAPTVNTKDEYINQWVDYGERSELQKVKNPNYVAPPDPNVIKQTIAAEAGVPVSSVKPIYGQMLDPTSYGTDRYVPDTSNIVNFGITNSDGSTALFNPNSGEFFTNVSKGGGGFLNELFAGIDSSLGLSKGVTAISGGLADLDASLGLSKNAPVIVGAAAAYFLPGIGQALGQSLVNAGVLTGAAATPAMATTIGTALAQTGVSVAQGKSLDEAITNAIISVGAFSQRCIEH
jgi:uncharacterized membrane protein YphA (DoxX/SURF4 family)